MKPWTPEQVLAKAEYRLTSLIARHGITPAVLIWCRMFERWYAEAVARTAVAS